MWQNPEFPANLVTFTEEILNRKLYILCSAYFAYKRMIMLKKYVNSMGVITFF